MSGNRGYSFQASISLWNFKKNLCKWCLAEACVESEVDPGGPLHPDPLES